MSVFRTSSPPPITQDSSALPEPVKNEVGAEENIADIEPLEVREESGGKDIVLEALDIDSQLSDLPGEDQDNVKEVKRYIFDIIKSKGLSSTVGAFKNTLSEIKSEMGLSEDSDPSVVLDRIGGVVKAWKNLSFISNPQEKRSLFMKLARQPDSKEMNRLVFDEMEKRSVWR